MPSGSVPYQVVSDWLIMAQLYEPISLLVQLCHATGVELITKCGINGQSSIYRTKCQIVPY